MVSLVDGLFGVVLIAGVSLIVLGWHTHRRWEQLGRTPLAVALLVFGFAAIGSSVVGFVGRVEPTDFELAYWAQVAFLGWGLMALPWLLFTLEYTGRYTRRRPRVLALLATPYLIIPVMIGANALDWGIIAIANVITSILFIYCLVLVLAGAVFLVQAARSYHHLSLWHGCSLAGAPGILFVAINSVGVVHLTSARLAVSVYTAGVLAFLLTIAIPLLGGAILEDTPAVETLGERAIASETDDLVFLVDEEEQIVDCNKTAIAEELPSDTVIGEPVATVLGETASALVTRETVTLETAEGPRRYDPQVSPITDGAGTQIGSVLALRDVTARELREERLAVLNRVLRHNLRNQVDVIKSHTELLAARPAAAVEAEDHLEQVDEAADTIAELGRSARTIDQFVSDSTHDARIDLSQAIRDVVDEVSEQAEAVDVTIESPGSATLTTNQRALRGALESAIENACSYAERTVSVSVSQTADGYRVRIADDGPGIPDNELESLDSGVETPLQHGTGLGLWQLKWAVRTMNGDLSFDTTDGTVVTFTVPDRAVTENCP